MARQPIRAPAEPPRAGSRTCVCKVLGAGRDSTARLDLPFPLHDSSYRHDAPAYAGVPRHRGRRAAHRHDPPRGQQERRADAARGDAAHVRAGRARQHAAHPRRRDDARAARRPRRRGRRGPAATRCACAPPTCDSHVARRGALGAHPRLDPARRPAARALRQRRRAAAGRRRHRPQARRLPPARLRGPGRRGDGRPHLSLPRAGRAQGHRVPPRRGLGDRHRERAHGRGAGRRA